MYSNSSPIIIDMYWFLSILEYLNRNADFSMTLVPSRHFFYLFWNKNTRRHPSTPIYTFLHVRARKTRIPRLLRNRDFSNESLTCRNIFLVLVSTIEHVETRNFAFRRYHYIYIMLHALPRVIFLRGYSNCIIST